MAIRFLKIMRFAGRLWAKQSSPIPYRIGPSIVRYVYYKLLTSLYIYLTSYIVNVMKVFTDGCLLKLVVELVAADSYFYRIFLVHISMFKKLFSNIAGGKRGLKRSPSGWRGLFWRSKLQRARAPPQGPPPAPLPPPTQQVNAHKSLYIA